MYDNQKICPPKVQTNNFKRIPCRQLGALGQAQRIWTQVQQAEFDVHIEANA